MSEELRKAFKEDEAESLEEAGQIIAAAPEEKRGLLTLMTESYINGVKAGMKISQAIPPAPGPEEGKESA